MESWFSFPLTVTKKRFASYYEVISAHPCSQLWTFWTKEGLVDKIAKKKKIFREPRSSGEVEAVLRQYEECIRTQGTEHRTQGTENTSPKDSSCMVDTRKLDGVTDGFPVTGAILLCVVGGKLSEGINFR